MPQGPETFLLDLPLRLCNVTYGTAYKVNVSLMDCCEKLVNDSRVCYLFLPVSKHEKNVTKSNFGISQIFQVLDPLLSFV